jgi:hypothetical protein
VSELGPDALVVRGGAQLILDLLIEQIEDAVDEGDGPVLSVFCAEPLDNEDEETSVERICTVAGIPHGKVFVTRHERLANLGITLERDTSDGQAPNHYHARFDLPVGTSQVQDFIACFDGPIPNPTGGRKGRSR